MAKRTIDLLPEIFRTDTNRKFLSATLDQLTQNPSIKQTQGYVGRRVGPGVNPADFYVSEPTATRSDYQLEPGVVFFKPDTTEPVDALTYPGMIDSLSLQGADVARQDRLFQSDYYTWDPFCDLDKFTNYSQYYWLPQGPDSVDVSTTVVPLTDDFDVTRNSDSYEFSGQAGINPVLTLVRGGNYQFNLNQPGHNFWIQAAPGVSGTMPFQPNISSRDVLGVINNGEDQGTVTFNVPLKTAQDFYYSLASVGSVDLITPTLKFNQVNNIYVDQFLSEYPEGIDGITALNGKTIVFLNTIQDAQDGGWQITTQYDPLVRTEPNQVGASVSYDVTGQNYDEYSYEYITNVILSGEPDPLDGQPGSFDSIPYDQTTNIDSLSERYSVWRIQYVLDNDGRAFMTLSSVRAIPNLYKFSVLFGNQYASTNWYKDASGFIQQIPLLTATLDELWYQDSTNPDIFGRIKLVDQSNNNPIDIDDIIGAKNYTSPNGVVFTNGLKVQFRGVTAPTRYQNLEYYVEGVGTGPGLDLRVGFIDGQAYFGPFHTFQGRKLTGAIHDEEVFQQYIYDTVEESLVNIGQGYPEGAPLPTVSVFGAVEGNGIKLLPVLDFVTPETYTQSETLPYDSTSYDSTPYDAALNAPEVPDYLTINRASLDRNAWSRSNRWFHVDVIRYTAERNNQVAILDNNFRAKRPIIEFRPNLALYEFGTQGKDPVNIVDFTITDAFSEVNGQLGFSTDGYTLINGSRIIFAADQDPLVRNRIYEVEFIDPDGTSSSPPIINLNPVVNGEALIGQTVVCLSGITLQGKSFYYDGLIWAPAQEKTSVNQAPLFDIFDSNGRSLSDIQIYPSTTFRGTKLFSYALGTTDITDEILGFALRYLNINNVGDIVFENHFYTDTFLYVINGVSQEQNISLGFARQYTDRTQFTDLIGWGTSAAENRSRQIFRFVYNDEPLILDVPVDESYQFNPIQLYQGTQYIDPDQYTYVINTNNSTTVTLSNPPEIGTIIEVQVVSNVASQVGFYQVPLNLENNPLNENSDNFTLGTIRTHYQGICQNLRNLTGKIDGANNTRDLGDILAYGDNIVQHSSPLVLSSVFLRQQQYEIISALTFNSREYEKFKARLLSLSAEGDFVNQTPSQILDSVIGEIALGRSDVSPFYWSDMLPAGQNYTETTYTYSTISTPIFDTRQTYDFTSSNFLGLLVYVNDQLLIKGYDYEVGDGTPTITITSTLSIGDVIKIREFANTYGTYVPNTPTKLGLYPSYKPEIFVDTNYVNPTTVIRGHDGSITVAFDDFRDQVLLEFETRVFNNLKIISEIPLTADDVIPGQFRDTDYTLQEINDILAPDFLNWVGWNKLDYTSQTYINTNQFTYNYSQSSNKLTGTPLLGAWRGIYQYFYDTVFPDSRPWEMLGFSQQPTWWETTYGPAPYTSGNMVLWDDLAQGLVRDPNGEYIVPQYVRPELSSVIPVGTEGELLSPLDTMTGNFNPTSFRRSWTFGDNGPVEYSWKASSSWPFAVMRLLALTKPAKFFSLFADRDRYVFDSTIGQYLWDERYRLDAKQLSPLYGDGNSKASYINWIIDYNRQLGVNSTDTLETDLANLGVRLCWRMAGFSDKRYLKLYTERSTPNSLNTSLLLPDESYSLLLYKNQAFEQITYSSVVIQTTDDGWQVYGYSTVNPYFNILASQTNGNYTIVEAGGTQVRVALDHSDNVVQVPYGYTFTNVTAVCDFLYSYGRLLEQQGFEFQTRENGYIMNWLQMVQEFLYWSNQGWSTGSLINLNPGAVKISVTRPGAVVESIAVPRPENLMLNQNRQVLGLNSVVIDRLGNTFQVTSLNENTINYANLRLTSYEHLIILDNVSIFADLIYQPVTGARQSRVRAAGIITADWNGTLDAPGFILNQNNIQEWKPNRRYSKGEIVLFKDEYWSASTIIQPSQEFDYTVWLKSDYDQIQTGLLPNAANSSDQLATAYSVYNANLEEEVDLFSYGLIGFRPREYMQNLNLDDVSQVNLYQQFLKTKGTRSSTELFTFADLGKEVAQYDIYEYWAMALGSYGATANRNYVEMLLNRSLLRSDPSLIQVILPQQTSEADQTVLLENLWKTSKSLTSTDIFPTVLGPSTQSSLPSAGYVNFNDVDFAVFALRDATEEELLTIGTGDTVWVAKSNAYDWNVYRLESLAADIIEVSDNLDGRSVVTFNGKHGLTTSDWLVIRFFDPVIDGAYQVRSVPDLFSVVIDFAFTGSQTTAVGEGVGFTLQSARVAQASDVAELPYSNNILPGSRVWVDNDGTGRWTVLEKINPFTPGQVYEPESPVESSQYGSSITQGFNNLAAMVGAPNYSTTGTVFTYVKDDQNVYIDNFAMDLDGVTAASGFGNAMDMGDNTWAIVGASASLNNWGYAIIIYNPVSSNAFQQWQLLAIPPGDNVTASDEFAYSVTCSQDERWMYVGAPGGNRVYAYGRVDVQNQSATYTTNGTQNVFNYSNNIVVDSASQLLVVVDGAIQTLGVDYTVNSTSVVFLTPPNPDLDLVIARRNELIVTGDGSTTTFALDDIYSADSIYSFAVYVNDVLQRPKFDYDFGEGSSLDLVFVTAPAADSSIRVRTGDYYRLVNTITVPGLASDVRFGHSVSTTSNGRILIVGCPGTDSSTGTTYVFDRSTQTFQITDSTDLTYTTQESLSNPGQPINVFLNGSLLINNDGNIGGQYSIASNTVTLDSDVEIEVGDILEVETNQFTLVQTVQSQTPFEAAQFGYVVDQCINDCSLYISAPYDGSILPEAGKVEFWQNQSRVYGTITSTIANPTLTAGNYLRINNYWVEVTGTTISELVDDINDAAIPNVLARSTADVTYVGDGITKEFAVGTLWSTADSYTTRVIVDDVVQTIGSDYTYDAVDQTVTFVVAPSSDSDIVFVSGRIIISVKNNDAAVPLNKLNVLPGSGTVFDDLGLEVYKFLQEITSPIVQDYAHFGQAIFISDNTTTLVVGAPDATAIQFCTFDNNTTKFDAGSTQFADPVAQSGAVYTFDSLPSANATVDNPLQFTFGQQIVDSEITALDRFGAAIDYTTGTLLIGSPGEDAGDSGADYGRVVEFINELREPAWSTLRTQQPVVDMSLMNTMYMYDRVDNNVKQYFDFFDPLQGKLLGAVRQNLDYIGAVDPAAYNSGSVNNYGDRWAQERVGQIWWNTTNARFVDPNQDDIVYASRRWGQLFPGSSVDVYQWIASTTPPAQYTGEGTVYSTTSYSQTSGIDEQGFISTTYYFWVSGLTAVNRAARKTLSIETLRRYIESPRSSGIAYIAPINSSTLAIYNGLEYIVAQDTVLHVEYDQELNDDEIHVEYSLISQDRADGFLPDPLYRKLLDSFCGSNSVGDPVPDPFLTPSEKFGTQFRPRQSMFANRFLALENYLTRANQIMAQFPISETRTFSLLRSEEAEPSVSSGEWNKRVANYTELTYQNLDTVPIGYKYLVATDSTNDGLWTIYELVSGTLPGSRELVLIRVQNYNTNLYWQYIDWYEVGYNPLTVITAEVANYAALSTISVANGSSVKVTANAQGKWEIYQYLNSQWIRVGLEDGTIQILPQIWDYSIGRYGFDVEVFDAQYFDQEPVIETRKIIECLNQEIFVDDLLIERNRLLILIFNYILSEQQAPNWLLKTSLVDVDHTIRTLEPFQIYRQDNQDFVLDYIQEVKPYHTQIREFNLIYEGSDQYSGTVDDFDLPAYYDASENLFISPVLDDTGTLSSTSSRSSNNIIWQTAPWSYWYQNYLLEIESVTIVNGGTGYTVAPDVIVTGNAVREAVMIARVNSAGRVIEIDILDPGAGYLTTPTITLQGGNGTGAQAVAVMGNGLVRNINTVIKYDRYQYSSTIVEWQPDVVYDNGTLVRYDDRVWEADNTDSAAVSSETFDPEQWTLVPAGSLSGVDRTMGYYAPEVNMPGLDLALLISGVEYPGVQVDAPDFNENTGFDVGNYDINPFDNISYGPEGLPTYDPAILDAIYESEFTDSYLGTRVTDVNVDGGEFVDTYSSHAPEELVPGEIFDTLDFKVFTTPGSDWDENGHGFLIKNINYEYDSLRDSYSFDNLIDFPQAVRAWNLSTGTQLYLDDNYTVNWVDKTIDITSGITNGEALAITAYGLGGGNQLYRAAYTGDELISNAVIIPRQFSMITELVVFVNGVLTTAYSYSQYDTYYTRLVFTNSYGADDYITITAMGDTTGSTYYSWSTPLTQYFTSNGIDLSFELDNSMSGSNPINLVVEVDGIRARPAEAVEYIADGSSLQYYIPSRGGFNLGFVSPNEVEVYINDQPLTLGVDFVLDAYSGSGDERTITLSELPDAGSVVIISVDTAADYYLNGNTLIWRPSSPVKPIAGDRIAVTSWNDTAQQGLITQVFVGPTTTGLQVSEGYDTTLYDQGSVTGDAGSFDFATGTVVQTNRFDTGRVIDNGSRLEVTLNGQYLFEGQDFVIYNSTVIELLGPVIGPADVVAITLFTQSTVPGAIGFRIFQDMRGIQSTYRITDSTTTVLTQQLLYNSDIIYVEDASALNTPNLTNGVFGVLTINGERITYRERDLINNTVSGLRRGTAGTGAATHNVGSVVYNLGPGNLLPSQYQDTVVFDNFLGDGSTRTFEAANISISDIDSTELVEAVRVYVGGILQEGGYTIDQADPVQITFDQAPTSGYQISIRVKRGLSWYEPGPGTASDGLALQVQPTQAARFIRGE